MTTPKQLAANRANALRSTGPRTEAGKAVSRLNAVKHGLLARDVLVDAGEGSEDVEEYATLVESLLDTLDPQGRLEHILVEKIAVSYWRLRRAARAEVGALRDTRDSLEARLRDDAEDTVIHDISVLVQGYSSLMPHGDPARRRFHDQEVALARRRIRSHPLGLRRLIEYLDAAMADLAEDRPLSAEASSLFDHAFIFEDGTLLRRIRPFLLEGDRAQGDDARDSLIAILQQERTSLEARLEDIDRRAALALEAARLQRSIPDDHHMVRIQRYEAMYERQLYAAINQLERLRRRRTGEPSIPPIPIELTTR